MSGSQTVYCIIIVIVVVTMIGIAIVWSIVLGSKPEVPTPPGFTQAGYDMRCIVGDAPPTSGNVPSIYTPQPCGVGLTCVQYNNSEQAPIGQTWGVCKKSIGEPCITVTECVPSALVCATVCSRSQMGGLNQVGPCDDATLAVNDKGICKMVIGTPGCSISSDCLSGSCDTSKDINVCAPQNVNGHPCIDTYDCISGNCNTTAQGSFCQQAGLITGAIGSACSYHKMALPDCDGGLSCYVDLFPEGSPPMSSTFYGVCSKMVDSWPGSGCSADASCAPPTICWNGSCVMPRTASALITNSCAVPDATFDNSTSGVCASGYKCSSEYMCIPDGTSKVPYVCNTWSLVKWVVQPDTIVGSWVAVADLSAPISSMSALAVDATHDMVVYGSPDGWMVVSSTGISRPITIRGTLTDVFKRPWKNNFMTGFQVHSITLTAGGNLLVQYTASFPIESTTPTLQYLTVSRGYIYRASDIPEIYDVASHAPITLNLPVYNKVPVETRMGHIYDTADWFVYPHVQGSITWMDVDDRIDVDGNIRALMIDQASTIYAGVMTIDQFNGIGTPALTNMGTGIQWAQFYAFTRGSHDPNEYVYQTTAAMDAVSVHVASGPPPIMRIPGTILPIPCDHSPITSRSMYSPVGGGVAQCSFMYMVQYPSAIGGMQARLFSNNSDVILPGYFGDAPGSQVAITHKSECILQSAFTPSYYMITPSSDHA